MKVAGRRMRVFTVNGTTPGPTLYATQGDLVKVVVTNRNIEAGTSIHWHGIDVPIAEDGVAGVTQNAIKKGDHFTYRFRAVDSGTYWYHSHQYALQQVTHGLVGALVITPSGAPDPSDVVAVAHSYEGRGTINATPGVQNVSGAVTGRRLRFVNTNQTRMYVASTAPYKVLSIDGYDLNGPTTVSASRYVEVPAAGRVDIKLDGGPSNARVGLIGGPSMVFGGGSTPPRLKADKPVDLLKYGTPDPTLHVPAPDRTFDYVIGQRTGYLDGHFGTWFSINGKLIPHVPMFMTNNGDNVRFRIVNHTSIDHPMHLHGQHFLVLSRDGVKSTGSPWWADTVEVHPGEQFVVQFHAANRGDWMFHCHILEHAAKGLMTHLSYMNLHNPYRIGEVSRSLTNHPE
jgi:FtsP/CotA-like multicopper oxidase with cupredoxin domain